MKIYFSDAYQKQTKLVISEKGEANVKFYMYLEFYITICILFFLPGVAFYLSFSAG